MTYEACGTLKDHIISEWMLPGKHVQGTINSLVLRGERERDGWVQFKVEVGVLFFNLILKHIFDADLGLWACGWGEVMGMVEKVQNFLFITFIILMKITLVLHIWVIFSLITEAPLFQVCECLPASDPQILPWLPYIWHFITDTLHTITDIVLVLVSEPDWAGYFASCCCCWCRRTAGSNQLWLAEHTQRNQCDMMTVSLWCVTSFRLERSHVSPLRSPLVFTFSPLPLLLGCCPLPTVCYPVRRACRC